MGDSVDLVVSKDLCNLKTSPPLIATSSPPLSQIHLISDTGASGPGHYIEGGAHHLLEGVVMLELDEAPRVSLPNGAVERATHMGYLPLPRVPREACRAFLFPNFSRSLLSIPTLCDHGCTATYTADQVTISFDNQVILTGGRNPHTGLWDHPMPKAIHANTVIRHENNADLVRFYHGAFMSPSLPTFVAAINKKFISPPGLTADMVRKNWPVTMATSKGHLDHLRKGLRSSQNHEPAAVSEDFEETFPSQSNCDQPHAVFLALVTPDRIHADQTGSFPIIAATGNRYYLVLYDERSNMIHAEAMASKTTCAYMDAFRAAFLIFQHAGALPPLMRVDNEIALDLTTALKARFNISCERAPPNQHRTLRAERAIRTFKNHFISGLSTCDPQFPMVAHDLLLPTVLLTLNMMRASNSKPSISAWEHIHGPFDWNRYVLAPPGMAVLVHEAPKTQRGTWAPHGQPGFYLGPAMSHYRCHRVWVTSTAASRVTDTVAWHPRAFHLPGSDPLELVTAAITDLSLHLQLLAGAPQHESLAYVLPTLLPQLIALRDTFQTPSHVSAPTLTPGPPLITQPPLPAIAPPSPISLQRVPQDTVPPAPTATLQRVLPDVITPLQRVDTLFVPVAVPPQIPIAVPPPSGEAPTSTRQSHRKKKTPQHLTCSTVVFAKDPSAHMRAIFPSSSPPQAPIPIIASASLAESPPHSIPLAPSRASTYTSLRAGPEGDRWEQAHIEEFERLIETTHTCAFIPWHQMPDGRNSSYYNPVCTRKGDSLETYRYRVRGTVADTHSDYEGPTAAYTASIPTVKILLNSVVSTPEARVCTADIKDYYLGTPMDRPEFIKVALRQIPTVIKDRYQLNTLAHNGTVILQVNKGMYGLVQAGRLAQEKLLPHLAKHGYLQCPLTPMLFRHSSRSTAFTLIVDDFCIKYVGMEDLQHLLQALREEYIITVDENGREYIGLTMVHDQINHTITLSMPNYVRDSLLRYRDSCQPTRFTAAPMQYRGFTYGAIQEAIEEDSSDFLPLDRQKRLESIVGAFLYYARALDITFAYPVSKISSLPKTIATEAIAEKFLDYAASWPNAQVTFQRSNMQLQIHSDASYLGETRARSRATGFHFLGPYDPSIDKPPNGFIDYFTSII